MATVTEIAEDVYRINVVLPGKGVTYSLFLINDALPTLVETSFGRVFDEVKEAVGKVLDPRLIRHIIVPHFEGDECGALKKFLDIAPNAMPVCSPVGASSVGDFAEMEPQTMADGEVLSIGSRRLRFILTPYVHLWDSLVVYEETQGVLYSSDLFMQPGDGPATTDQDLSDQMVASYRLGGLMPSMRHLHSALDKLEPLLSETPGIKTVACHHGSVLTGGITPYFKALRENDVTAAALA